MTTIEDKTKIKAFMAHFFRDASLQEDDNIFERGYINSLFAMQLVLFLEQEFQIVIENEDLDMHNFETINAIALLIEQKRASRTIE